MSYLLDEQLKGVKTVGMAGHVRPDGDCVGSVLAVYNYITDRYPEIEVHAYLEPIPEIFSFMKNAHRIEEAGEERVFDLFIVLDCGDLKRIGKAAPYFENAKRTFCIDHHLSNQNFADENYIFPHASAACELCCEVMDPEGITKEIAECLYTGIVTDTGVFQYDSTSPKTLRTVAGLVEKGIDFSRIIESTFFEKTWSQNRIMGRALVKSRLHADGRIISSYITREEEKEFDTKPSDFDGIAEQLRVTRGVKVSVFLHEMEDGRFKASTRATGHVNLAELAMQYGGGGHAKAAGFTISGAEPEEMIDEIVDRVTELLHSLGELE